MVRVLHVSIFHPLINKRPNGGILLTPVFIVALTFLFEHTIFVKANIFSKLFLEL